MAHRMTEGSQYWLAVRVLLQARPGDGQPAPERLEENLNWLVRLTQSEAKASEALRERVRAIAMAHRAWLEAQEFGRECPWPEFETALSEPEREMLALLLSADLDRLPEDTLVRSQAQRVMRRLLDAMPESQREALLLQVTQGLSVREIGQVLGCTEGEAVGMLQQARRSIYHQAQSIARDALPN